jgi:beta-galactosidase
MNFMKWKLLLLLLSCTWLAQAQERQGTPQLFDEGWKFYRGGVERGEDTLLDDSRWRMVDLPHDWSIEDLPGKNTPFDPDAISQVSGGFTVGGTGWYRKTIVAPENVEDQQILLLFEGIYMNADIWLNGQHLADHPYGYTSFWLDLTGKLRPGKKNILAIQVKNEGQNSRWYSGSGINRHVWLYKMNAVHLAPWGVYITTPQVTTDAARVQLQAEVENSGKETAHVKVVTRIQDPEGREVAQTSQTQQVTSKEQIPFSISIPHPQLWSPDAPRLYSAIMDIYVQDRQVDHVVTTFGIRTISVDANRGFLLNGVPLKLKGGCFHNDNGPLGSRAYDRAEERRVALMKASGFNAIRCSHNPPAPAFLRACDRLGMLVIDETFDMWKEGKNPYDYHLYFNDWWQKDVESMVRRDRNHPSVIMWSIGNEIPNRDKPEVVAVAQSLADYIRKMDPSRPITAAVNDVKEDKDPFFAVLDVAGYNYADQKYEQDHQRKPNRVMMATESYALEAFDYWMGVVDHPYVIGDFVWTGFDYIGEASIGWLGYYQEKNFYPWNLAYCGDIDICGWKRPQSYYRDVLWKPNQLSLFVTPPKPSFKTNPRIEAWSKWNWEDVVDDWNWKGWEGKPLKVTVYASCDEVELFLNQKSLGRKPTNRSTQMKASWEVPYAPGELKAVGYANQVPVKETVLRTAGNPVKLSVQADRDQLAANGQDLSYITVELQDSHNIRNPKAEQLVHFSVEGPATIIGVGNANPMSTESYQQPRRKAWRGRCLVVVKTQKQPGTITVKATADGIGSSTIHLQSR